MRYLLVFGIFLFVNCNNNRENTRSETSYSKDKYSKFILNNITSHFSPDTTNYYNYLSFLTIIDSISSLKYSEDSLKAIISPLWIEFNKKHMVSRRQFSNKIDDSSLLTLDNIFENIDAKYDAWKKNRFTNNQPEVIFIKHILPYRIIDKVMPDDYFIKRSSQNLSIINNTPSTNIKDAVDSLLIKYRDIVYSVDFLPSFPYLTTSSILHSKHIRCEERVWFNYYLLSSVGIPTAIDFTPNWGNRNASHTWNVIVTKDSIIPFEPFYSSDRWEYKSIYNNEAEDGFVKWWGKFRLPKVYRFSYGTFKNELIKDDRVSALDIPPLFRTDKIVDVSSEYFQTADVKFKLSNKQPEGVFYAFLCVHNRKSWVPVQYSKIRHKRVKFKGMGMDIVYLPAYYKKGKIIPAGEPFYLSKDGIMTPIVNDVSKTISLKIDRRYPLNDKKYNSHKKLVNSYFVLAQSSDFKDSIISLRVSSTPQMKVNISKIDSISGQYRYVRFVCNQDSYLSELKIVIQNQDTLLFDSRYIEQNTKDRKSLKQKYIDIDLGSSSIITDLGFCGLDDKFCVLEGKTYELFYWDDEWISTGKQVATSNYLIYKNIPDNKLYYIDCSDNDAFKRIFIYKDNKQLFW